VSFLHVHHFTNRLVMWRSVGLLLADSILEARSTTLPRSPGSQDAPADSAAGTAADTAEGSTSSNTLSNTFSSTFSSTINSTTGTGSGNSTAGGSGRKLLQQPATSPATQAPLVSNSSSRISRAARQLNYVLAADNDTLAWQIQQLGAQDVHTPCLIYIDANVTLAKPPVPEQGIAVMRPLVLVGLMGWTTSIDWHMEVSGWGGDTVRDRVSE
jgi:hypothetical protein